MTERGMIKVWMGDPREERRRWKEWKTKASKAEWVQCLLSHYITQCGCELNGPNTPNLEYNMGLYIYSGKHDGFWNRIQERKEQHCASACVDIWDSAHALFLRMIL